MIGFVRSTFQQEAYTHDPESHQSAELHSGTASLGYERERSCQQSNNSTLHVKSCIKLIPR